MIRRILTFIFVAAVAAAFAAPSAHASDRVTVGAERTAVYGPMLSGKRVALFSNHTGVVPDGRHTLDVMLCVRCLHPNMDSEARPMPVPR